MAIFTLSRPMLTILLLVAIQGGCSRPVTSIKFYVIRRGDVEKVDATLLLKDQLALVLTNRDIRQVQLVQHENDRFSIEVQLGKEAAATVSAITTENVGRRLAIVSDSQILLSPLIIEPILGDKIVLELAATTRREARDLATHFSPSFKFYDQRVVHDSKQGEDLRRAYIYREKGECERAIEAFGRLIKETNDPTRRAGLYNEIALCYRLENDRDKAAETYRMLINEIVSVDLDNYRLITQAYFYLSRVAKDNGDINTSQKYLDRAISTLEEVTARFPATRSAEWANLTIGSYELLRGNAETARKRAGIAKAGMFGGQAYLLVGLSYEYEKKYKSAKDEYEVLIKKFPNTDESRIAEEFIGNLERGRTNIAEFTDMLERR